MDSTLNFSITGLPLLIVGVGFIVVFSAPVWLAARVVGVKFPSLLRAAASLAFGVIGSVIAVAVGGRVALLLAPAAFLLSFKFVLGTSFIGAIVLAILSLAGYAAMVHFIGSSFSISGGSTAA